MRIAHFKESLTCRLATESLGIVLVLTILLLAIAMPLAAQEGSSSPPKSRSALANDATMGAKGEVLILYGLTSQMPVYDKWSRGIQEGLRDEQGNAPINVEFLDLARYDDRQHTRMWLDLIRHKYSQRDIRVVIPVLGPAFRFAMSHLRELFPEAAIVFASVDEREAGNLTGSGGVTGIVYRADIGKTCELALQLRPHTQRIVCISGSSEIGKSLDQLARRELEPLEKRLDVVYWHGVGLNELKRRVRDLPDDHVVLFTIYFLDENGRDYVPAQAVAALCDESTVPVFGLHKTLLDYGVLGGCMIDLDAQALAAGRAARQVLDGEDPGRLSIRGQELNRPLVHWQRLQHWNVPESNVPSHVTVLHRVPTLWESYRWLIVATFTILTLQFGLIVTLLLNRLQRQRAEQALMASQDVARRQRDELARVNRLTTVEELATSIAHEVNQPLSAIVSNAQAALRLLGQPQADPEEVTAALQDITTAGNRAAGILTRVRSLARKQEPTLAPLDLDDVVRDVLRLAGPDAKANEIVIREELDDRLPAITGDSIQLQQVILNLLVNAAQAMRTVEPDSRRITVRTVHDTTSASVYLSVEDCGVGLDDQQLKHIFDAFYTTRTGGIGMGLSISRSIIEAHGGKIWATQNPGRGATFHVTLPTAGRVARRS